MFSQDRLRPRISRICTVTSSQPSMRSLTNSNAFPFREAEIRSAMESGDLFYVYQPTVSLLTGKVCGAEALIRWNRQGETICPDDFIPQAEQSSLAVEITNTMLPTLFRDMAAMNRRVPDLVTAFNAGANDCLDGKMTTMLVEAIADGRIKAGNIRIEITETHLTDNIARLHDQFQILLDAGVRLAMDDLGKGYSSLDLLARLPFTCLKIDRGIVGELGKSSKARHIIGAICDMAGRLEVTLIAEGVETSKSYTELKRLGCHLAQGYWIGKPMPFDEYMNFVLYHHEWGIEKAAA